MDEAQIVCVLCRVYRERKGLKEFPFTLTIPRRDKIAVKSSFVKEIELCPTQSACTRAIQPWIGKSAAL